MWRPEIAITELPPKYLHKGKDTIYKHTVASLISLLNIAGNSLYKNEMMDDQINQQPIEKITNNIKAFEIQIVKESNYGK